MAIRIDPCVRFVKIPEEMISMFEAIIEAAKRQGKEPIITGAGNEHYPKGKVHDAGYAIDVRIHDIPDPERYAEDIRFILGAVSSHYTVLYGDEGHKDHIHIGFAWYFAIP